MEVNEAQTPGPQGAWDRVAIVGVGLIGGSIGLALRCRAQAREVVGIGRDAGRLDEARRLGAIDRATTRIEEGVIGADVVVVCTPVSRIGADVCEAARSAAPAALITDAGSTKRLLVEQVEADPGARARFVGAHPIAGSERKGAAAASAGLFDGRVCVLTPTPRTDAGRLGQARQFWAALGCRLVELDPARHDEALARTSHLPHAVAAALAAAVPVEDLDLAAGAYRDGTRVAGSDAGLWTAIFLANRGPMLEALERFGRQVERFRASLAEADAAGLERWWEMARTGRLHYDSLHHPRPETQDSG